MTTPVHPYCTFKTLEIEMRTRYLCETALEVLNCMAEYCKDRALPLTITDSVSTSEEDHELARVSDEHRTGRAFDISLRGWLEVAVLDFTNYFEKKFLCVAAIGKVSNEPRLIFRHNSGHGDHIHVQVARLFGVNNPLKISARSDDT